jgi:hypothetical protein
MLTVLIDALASSLSHSSTINYLDQTLNLRIASLSTYGDHRGHTAGVKKLPVAVLIPSGAFNRGAARMHNIYTMLAYFAEPWIAVSMQYRIGVFGGLNTDLTVKEGLLNLGLMACMSLWNGFGGILPRSGETPTM